MSYSDAAKVAGREPLQFVELHLDSCANTFGSAPCTATLGAAGRCYNTRATCQDVNNYNRTTKVYRFLPALAGLRLDIEGIPSLDKVSTAPTRLTPGRGLGYRANIKVTLIDHPHHDRGIDPYFSTRPAGAEQRGTFWRKLLARSPHYNGRILRVLSGFLEQPLNLANFVQRDYVIERIDGPNAAGRVQITAKDILKLADDKRAQCPVASTGALAADIGPTDTSLTLTTGTGAEYGSAGEIRISDEIIGFSGRSGDTLTGLTRGQWGTVADEHGADDAVQLCVSWSAVNVRDIIEDLLVNYAGIDSTYINTTDWDTEALDWLSAYSLTAIISEPTGVNTLLGELTEQCQLMLWWDEAAQLIRLKAIVPPKGNLATTLTDAQHFVADSVDTKDGSAERITQLWVYYDPDDYTESARKNYKRLFVRADLDAEGADQYGDQRIEVIESRWFNETNAAAVAQTAGRIFNARVTAPRFVEFSLDAKDLENYATGDIVDILTDRILDAHGNPRTVRGILTEHAEAEAGTRIDYKFMSGVGAGRFGFIGPNTLGDYSAESDANRAAYAFIGPDAGSFPDLGERYKII